MRALLIDNYDSYTYNLYQLMAMVYGSTPTVVRNDDGAWDRLELGSFDCAVISPGPGHPATRRDFGHSRTVLRRDDLPVLGVCLGHQGIGLVYGAGVARAPQPRHGYLTQVRHTGHGIFAGLPQGFTGVRYHSLCVTEPLPAELEAIAWAEDGVIMGIRHRHLPRWGLQFHPESICTEHGARLLENFRDLALPAAGRPRAASRRAGSPSRPEPEPAEPAQSAQGAGVLQAYARRIDHEAGAEAVFAELYGASTRAFWLDSALVVPGTSRFSFLGDSSGPTGEVLTYRVEDDFVTVEPSGRRPYSEPGTIFEALERRTGSVVAGADRLPFDMVGGYVGYLGYELKAICGATNAHRAQTPDAIWLRADRFIAIDHLRQQTYVVAVAMPEAASEALGWIERTAAALLRLRGPAPQAGALLVSRDPSLAPRANPDLEPWLARPRARYLADIAECQRQLRAGESYEICLTNKLRVPAPAPDDDLSFYLRLRRLNPAPYSAFLRIGDLAVFSSSPERFMRVDAEHVVEARPIKGTAPRSPDREADETIRLSLLSDPKSRAENLMIVDLLRNDLGQICEIGSVTVPKLMVTESYATVHQLVSTIRGKLRPDLTAPQCVRACFPGGSMTGAPKLRTMEILDALESQARGVYSGALGHFGFTGTADLSIVIRTAVRWRGELTVGAGGAIVLDSDPQDEYDEMMLKARASMQAVEATGSGVPLTLGKAVG